MKHIKIAAGLAHVNYGRIADLVKEVSDAGVDYIHSDAADMHDLQNMKLMEDIRSSQGSARKLINLLNVISIRSAWTKCSLSRSMKQVQIC